MNTMQKMRYTNSKCRQALTALGFHDIIMFGHSRWRKDVYSFDGVALKEHQVWWLQFKTGYASKKDKVQMELFVHLYEAHALLCEYILTSEKNANGRPLISKCRITYYPSS